MVEEFSVEIASDYTFENVKYKVADHARNRPTHAPN